MSATDGGGVEWCVSTTRTVVCLLGLIGNPISVPAQAAPPLRWRATVDLTIGGTDATDDASLGRISGLAVDRGGRIYVADASDDQIRVFSPAGAPVARIGRTGSGPLEFKHLATISIGPDQLLWVRDEGNARMLGINAAVTPPLGVKNVPLSPFTGGSHMPIAFEPDGSFVDETIWYDKSMDAFRPLRLLRNAQGVVSRTDTLPVPAGAFAAVGKETKVQKDASGTQTGISQRYFFQPHGGVWLRAYGPNGIRADVVTSRYEVRVLDAAGQLIRTITRDPPRVALSAREKHAADSSLRVAGGNAPFGVPSAKAPILAVAWSSEGRLWVERAVADGQLREADVFDGVGRYIAVAEWPRDVGLATGFPVIVGNTLTAVAADANGNERIVRLRFR